MKASVNERFLVSPYFVFFLLHSSQVGVGILTFQRDIIQAAGYDAWISIILSGLSIHVLVWMMYRILRTSNQDVFYINQWCFGKGVGRLLNSVIILYFLLTALIVLRSYVQVVQVWMFPVMKTWQVDLILLVLVYYIVSSGFRVITGVCFWGVVIPFILIFPLFFFPLEFARITNLLPLFNHSVKEIAASSKTMLLQFLGFEVLFMVYPFIKHPEKSEKWAQGGVLFTLMLHLILAVITFSYFSEGHLKHNIWPTLTLIKIAQMPFIERVEYIVVSLWCLVILPYTSLSLWSVCRGVRKLIHVKNRITLSISLLIVFLGSHLIKDSRMIIEWTQFYTHAGFYFAYVYIPLVFVAVHLKQKWMQRKPIIDGEPTA